MKQETDPGAAHRSLHECQCDCCRLRRYDALLAAQPAGPVGDAPAPAAAEDTRRGARVKKTGQTLLLLRTGTAEGLELVDPASIRWVEELSLADAQRSAAPRTEDVRKRNDRLFGRLAAAFVAVLLPVAAYAFSHSASREAAPLARLDYRPELEADARQGIADFLAAGTWQKKLGHVAQPERVSDAMKDWYEAGGSDDDLSPAQFYVPASAGMEENDVRGITMLARPEETGSAGRLSTAVPMLYFFQHGKLDWESFLQSRRGGVQAALSRAPDGARLMLRTFLLRRTADVPLDSLVLCELSSEYVPAAEARTADDALRAGPLTSQLLPGQPRAAVVEVSKSADGNVVLHRLVHWDLLPAPQEPLLIPGRRKAGPPTLAAGES